MLCKDSIFFIQDMWMGLSKREFKITINACIYEVKHSLPSAQKSSLSIQIQFPHTPNKNIYFSQFGNIKLIEALELDNQLNTQYYEKTDTAYRRSCCNGRLR